MRHKKIQSSHELFPITTFCVLNWCQLLYHVCMHCDDFDILKGFNLKKLTNAFILRVSQHSLHTLMYMIGLI